MGNKSRQSDSLFPLHPMQSNQAPESVTTQVEHAIKMVNQLLAQIIKKPKLFRRKRSPISEIN